MPDKQKKAQKSVTPSFLKRAEQCPPKEMSTP